MLSLAWVFVALDYLEASDQSELSEVADHGCALSQSLSLWPTSKAIDLNPESGMGLWVKTKRSPGEHQNSWDLWV